MKPKVCVCADHRGNAVVIITRRPRWIARMSFDPKDAGLFVDAFPLNVDDAEERLAQARARGVSAIESLRAIEAL